MHAWVDDNELANLIADRNRIIEARDRNPHINHWKVPYQIEVIDRHIERLTAAPGTTAANEAPGAADKEGV